jgi:hypothetical protein
VKELKSLEGITELELKDSNTFYALNSMRLEKEERLKGLVKK